MNRIWTQNDIAKIVRLRNAGRSDTAIAKIMGRTRTAVSSQFWKLRLGPEALKEHYAKYNLMRKKKRVPHSTLISLEVRTIYRPTPEMLADRDMRVALPARDLAGAFFGDPPVGLSALERRS